MALLRGGETEQMVSLDRAIGIAENALAAGLTYGEYSETADVMRKMMTEAAAEPLGEED